MRLYKSRSTTYYVLTRGKKPQCNLGGQEELIVWCVNKYILYMTRTRTAQDIRSRQQCTHICADAANVGDRRLCEAGLTPETCRGQRVLRHSY